jgi:thioredoxin 2
VPCALCGALNRVDMERVSAGPRCGQCGKPMLLDRPVAVTDESFERVIQGAQVPVVVDFYADWCAPCKVMAPIFDELAQAYAGRVLFTKLDTDKSPVAPSRLGIRGIPTLIVFRDGAEAARQVGAVPRAQLETLLESVGVARAA